MTIFSGVRANLFLAAQAVDGPSGVEAQGIGFRFLALQPNGMTSPFSLVALVDVSADGVGADIPVAVTLCRAETGEPVVIVDDEGAEHQIRVAQNVRPDRPEASIGVTPDGVEGRITVVFTLDGGLPLDAGEHYSFVLEIDGQTVPGWTTGFHVVDPAARAVAPTGLREYVVDVPRK
jgi:hypothetical protein